MRWEGGRRLVAPPIPASPSPSFFSSCPHLQSRLCSQASKGARQDGGAGPGPEKAQAGTKVWRRRSPHAGLPHGQNSSAWVSAGGPRAKKRRRARRQRARGQPPGGAGPRHCATYSVRNRWHRLSAVHASAASTHRFCAAELDHPGGGTGRLQFSVRSTSTLHPGSALRRCRALKTRGGQSVAQRRERLALAGHPSQRGAALGSADYCDTSGMDGAHGAPSPRG